MPSSIERDSSRDEFANDNPPTLSEESLSTSSIRDANFTVLPESNAANDFSCSVVADNSSIIFFFLSVFVNLRLRISSFISGIASLTLNSIFNSEFTFITRSLNISSNIGIEPSERPSKRKCPRFLRI